MPSPPESEDEEEGMYDEGDGFLGSEGMRYVGRRKQGANVREGRRKRGREEGGNQGGRKGAKKGRKKLANYYTAQYQQILSVNFPVNVKTFFKIFFSDDSTFTQHYHITRGDKGFPFHPLPPNLFISFFVLFFLPFRLCIYPFV